MISSKGHGAIELLTPLLIGSVCLLLRGLLPAPGMVPERVFPAFSPHHLPQGRVPDVDAIMHTNG